MSGWPYNIVRHRFGRFNSLMAVGVAVVLLAACFMLGGDLTQVRVGGRVVTMETVSAEYDGDISASGAVQLPVGSSYLTPERVMTEHVYNNLHFLKLCAVSAFLLFLASLFFRDTDGILKLSLIPLSLIAVDTVLNGVLAGALPLVSVADTLRIVALLLLLMAFLFRTPSSLTYAVVFALVVASEVVGIHPALKSYNPILDSVWLPVHVTFVLIAYSFFIFAATVSSKNRLYILLGEICLGCGIILGSLWAHEAWGSYWSWDPKETAALVSFVLYLLLLAVCRRGISRLPAAIALVSVVVTWFCITTGMHAY